jgi:PilZ domain
MAWGTVRDRRKYSRAFLDLPIEFHINGVPDAHAGIAVDGSEIGFLMYTLQNISEGEQLSLTVLFPNGFELANLEAKAEVVRRVRQERGYRYGLRVVRINEVDHVKLRYILCGLHELPTGEGLFDHQESLQIV